MTVRNLEQKLTRIDNLRRVIQAYQEELKAAESSLDELEVGQYATGSYILKIQENRRFDPAIAKRVLAPDVYNSLCRYVPDTKVAKTELSGNDYRACQKVSGRRIIVKHVD